MGEDLYLLPICKLGNPIVMYDSEQKMPLIEFARGVDPCWEKGGKILSWCYANQFCRINPDKIIAAAQKKYALCPSDADLRVVEINPDQIITMNVSIPFSHAHGAIALLGVRIITTQSKKVIEQGTVIIRDGHFTAVGPRESVNIPPGSKILDMPGTTIMPGFVDLHLHMRLPPDIFPQQSWMYLVNLAYGVTTARDPSANFDSFGYSELLESGNMIGPRLFTVGRAVRRYSEGIITIDSLYNAKAIVSKRAILGGTVVKQYALPTRLQRQWLLIASKEAGLNMTNEGHIDPILEIGMMKDGSTGVEHNAAWGDVYKDILTFIAKAGTYLTPTLQVSFADDEARDYYNYLYWREPDAKLMRFTPKANLQDVMNAKPKDTTDPGFLYPSMFDAEFRKHGGRVTLGSHGNDEGIGVHNELWALQKGGLNNMEALQAATIMGAEAIGIQKDIGSIEVGKLADLIVLNKNPLDDIHNSREIRYVMKGGILYDGNTLDEIWPEPKKCPEWRLK